MVKTLILLGASLLFFTACSDEDKGSGDHIWQEQTQAIDKAKEIEGLLLDSAAEQRKIIDEQTQ